MKAQQRNQKWLTLGVKFSLNASEVIEKLADYETIDTLAIWEMLDVQQRTLVIENLLT